MSGLSDDLAFARAHRVLVLAPHPDDETLATGLLVQRALAAGAGLRIVIATDGDDNPWPQRWLERRWRIDAAARARWGRRRREESLRALDVLGVPRSMVRHLGWPDGGLTERLMGDGQAERVLREEISTFAPTHVALPVFGDRHPDHTALRVLAELASAGGPAAPALRLGFTVHACGRELATAQPAPNGAALERKLQALSMHGSQLSLSAKRLHAMAAREECFTPPARATPFTGGGFTLPLRGFRLHARELLLVAIAGGRVRRGRLRLPAIGAQREITLSADEGAATEACVRRHRGGIEVVFGGAMPDLVYAKLHRCGPRLVIFDDEGWHVFGDQAGDDGGEAA